MPRGNLSLIYQSQLIDEMSGTEYICNAFGLKSGSHGAMRLCSAELAGELRKYIKEENKYEQLEIC